LNLNPTIYDIRNRQKTINNNQQLLEMEKLKTMQSDLTIQDPFREQELNNRLEKLTGVLGPWNKTVPIQNVLPHDNMFHNFINPVGTDEMTQDSTPNFLRRTKMLTGTSVLTGPILSDNMPEFDKETNPKVVHIPRNFFIFFFL
jgi:hypothetical protein